MRNLNLLLISAVLFLSGCSNEATTNYSDAPASGAAEVVTPTAPSAPSTPTASDSATPAVEEKKLPFDMPIMPEARYLSGIDFSKPTKRRGPEAIATIIAKGTTLDVVSFYEKALTENGFTATLGKHNDESSATVRGVRQNGDTFSVTSMRRGSKAKEGECQTAIVATKPKPPESE